jgi:hypothetical protein
MRKKSKYKPRPVLVNPLAYVLEGFEKVTDHKDENVKVRLKNRLALDALMHGTATGYDVDLLVNVANVSTALAIAADKGREWLTAIRAGVDAIEALRNRPRKLCTGLELQAIRLLLDINDAQLDAATILDVEAAIKLVRLRERQGVMV